MKYLIASDIHGSALFCSRLLECFREEKAGRLILLGDILYHGPRNDLPAGYDPKKVIELLNPLADRILAVRGNCDTEVDQMVLAFPVLAEYAVLSYESRLIYMTHGHKSGDSTAPRPCPGDILLCGHTHIPACEERGDTVYLNPGSVSIPKNGSRNSFMTFDNGLFLWKTLDGEIYKEYRI